MVDESLRKELSGYWGAPLYAVRCDVQQRRGRDAERLVVGKWRDVGVSEMWRRIQRLGMNHTSTE